MWEVSFIVYFVFRHPIIAIAVHVWPYANIEVVLVRICVDQEHVVCASSHLDSCIA